jgi:hypothetical protein
MDRYVPIALRIDLLAENYADLLQDTALQVRALEGWLVEEHFLVHSRLVQCQITNIIGFSISNCPLFPSWI